MAAAAAGRIRPRRPGMAPGYLVQCSQARRLHYRRFLAQREPRPRRPELRRLLCLRPPTRLQRRQARHGPQVQRPPPPPRHQPRP